MRTSPLPIFLSGLVLLVTALGCASEPPPPAQAPRAEANTRAKEAEVNEWSPQTPLSKWWEAGSSACPEGATLVGAAPPKGNVIQCVLGNGEPHGLSTVWFGGGHEGTQTAYKNGVRHGRWLYWLHNHILAAGQFEDGRRSGTWTFWFDEGSGLDMKSRYDRDTYSGENYVLEEYNKGLLIKTVRYKDGAPVGAQPGKPVQAAAELPGDPSGNK